MSDQYNVIGLMSGTSLDGLDIAYCRFVKGEKWHWQILHHETVSYDNQWQQKLTTAHRSSAAELFQLDAELAEFHSQCINAFLQKHKVDVHFISSHGHTILHAPKENYTCQIANGGIISSQTGIPVICDFRTQDVALGGQGAPLVPGAEFILFEGYDGFLNLGGIANLSVKTENGIEAFDVCTCNMFLNACAALKGDLYDHNGAGASAGNLIPDLLDSLNANPFYFSVGPASIGKEFFESHVWPETLNWHAHPNDLLRTAVEHIASVVSHRLPPKSRVLVSGGGAYNTALL
ncbi:MAG: anhydro-N-acetylmuramic acid kinase, partial [Flavobacteriales bacterium]